MIYWFPSFPATPHRFEYTQENFETDVDYLTHLTEEIQNLGEDQVTRTTDLKRCAYCRYRSLCDRGISAGTSETGLDEDTPDLEFTLDFDAL